MHPQPFTTCVGCSASSVNRGRPSSKYHLAVEAHGWPVAAASAPGTKTSAPTYSHSWTS